MSEEIKPKKERKFLKTLGKIGEVLIQELFFKVGSNLIRKIGGKKTLPSILFLFLSLSLFAQFPSTGNKQRLGFQTTADGLTWRGSISDTASIQPINNQSAWVILDTINLKFYTFDFSSNVWNLVGGAAFTQPVDSLFFNVNVPTNNVDTAKMRWDSDLATVVLGLNDNVPNEIGFKNFWLVKNQTGSTITKGSLVYANGTVGASGRITVDKFIANGSIDAKYLLGITAHDLTDGEDGYVISFGKIRQVNTDTFAAGAILYPSPTVAGVWTDVEPVAPNIDMPIGFCINSSVNNGTIAIRVASGYKLSELHDVAISSPIEKASLYYSGGLWRDTTAALLVSDTASMLTPYFRDADTTSLNLTSRFAEKQNTLSGTGFVKASGTTISYDNSSYLRTGLADSTYLKLTGGTLSGDLDISKSSNSILRLSSADPGSYGKLIFSSNNGGFLNYGASIESSGDGVGVDVGSLNFLTGYGTVRTNRMTITPTGNLTIVNSATIGGTLGVTGATTLGSTLAVSGDITENGNNVLTSADTSAFARDNQISGTSGQVAYFNSSNSVISDAGLIYNATNKSLGINTTTTSGANLIIKNSQEPSRATVVATQTFAADTTNWTRGAGWTFDGTQAVATASTGDLTYTPALTITSGNAYEITYTVTGYSAGTLTVALGNVNLALPTHNATANVILLSPTSATGGFRFTTSSFTGNLDNVSVVEISNAAPIIFAGQDDNGTNLYSTLRMPNSTSLMYGGGGRYTTGGNNIGNGTNALLNITTGSNNVANGLNSLSNITTGSNNVGNGTNSLRQNTIGSNNIANGSNTLQSNISGNFNVANGGNALFSNLTGSSNVANGLNALRTNTIGSNNVANGTDALYFNVDGTSNIGNGTNALLNNTSGSNNVAEGENSLRNNTTGTHNVAIGVNSLGNTNVAQTLTGSNNIGIGRNAGDNISGNALSNVAIGDRIDFTNATSSNQGVYQNVLFFTGASGTGTTIAAASKAGIKTNAPNRDLEVAGEVRITDLTTDTPTRLVGADADGDLGQVTLGSTLSLTGSSLGVTSNTFLPLTGGTLTGTLNGTSQSLNNAMTISDNSTIYTTIITGPSSSETVKFGLNQNISGGSSMYMGGSQSGGGNNSNPNIFFTDTQKAYASIGGIHTSGASDNKSGHIVFNTTPNLTTTALTERMRIAQDGAITMGSTLGVTGATTLSAPLTVNSSAVFNEGSADADFRVEGDANANMIFVDASTDRVGIGTNTPAKTLDVNGELNVSSAGTFGGRLNTNWLERTYSNSTATSLTVSVNTTWLKLVNNSTITLTLPNAATYPGKELHVKNAGTGAVNSLSSNIEPLNSTTIGTAILASGGGKWATLVSDGSNWVIMAGN
jgi:hypothetical protein